MWAGLRAARGSIRVGGVPNCLNYCEIFVVYTQFTNVAVGRNTPWRAACWSPIFKGL
jgi:hypothetical protein